MKLNKLYIESNKYKVTSIEFANCHSIETPETIYELKSTQLHVVVNAIDFPANFNC